MTTTARTVLLVVAVALALAACSGSAGAGAASKAPVTVTPQPSDPSTGGGSAGSTGSGAIGPNAPRPGGSHDPSLPDTGSPTPVVPKPGRLDVHPVGATVIEPTVDGSRVSVKLSWWSGVAPCSVLDSVEQVRTGRTIVLTILEGADQRGVACIEIAMLKATLVDLGELPTGSYTITAGGDASPVPIVVP
ncbi:MAG TPA: hypothetical protein VLR93_01030 [Patescibacteria group bacterium]|nr:hypothetical protein [Patescibacteria group bacterium]